MVQIKKDEPFPEVTKLNKEKERYYGKSEKISPKDNSEEKKISLFPQREPYVQNERSSLNSKKIETIQLPEKIPYS